MSSNIEVGSEEETFPTNEKFSIAKEELPYQPCYCEENVWQLCKILGEKQPELLENSWVVFVSNQGKTVPLYRQQAGEGREGGLVIWDYHVFLLLRPSESSALVFDMDTTLPFPSPFQNYVQETFQDESRFKPQFLRRFRLIPGSDFLRLFSSDRSHMVKPDGSYVSPPPSWPKIQPEAAAAPHNLPHFWDMNPTHEGDLLHTASELFNLDSFRLKFSSGSA